MAEKRIIKEDHPFWDIFKDVGTHESAATLYLAEMVCFWANEMKLTRVNTAIGSCLHRILNWIETHQDDKAKELLKDLIQEYNQSIGGKEL